MLNSCVLIVVASSMRPPNQPPSTSPAATFAERNKHTVLTTIFIFVFVKICAFDSVSLVRLSQHIPIRSHGILISPVGCIKILFIAKSPFMIKSFLLARLLFNQTSCISETRTLLSSLIAFSSKAPFFFEFKLRACCNGFPCA